MGLDFGFELRLWIWGLGLGTLVDYFHQRFRALYCRVFGLGARGFLFRFISGVVRLLDLFAQKPNTLNPKSLTPRSLNPKPLSPTSSTAAEALNPNLTRR